MVGVGLGHLLEVAVQIPELHIRLAHLLAVDPGDDAEGAVRRRMRGTDVEDRRVLHDLLAVLAYGRALGEGQRRRLEERLAQTRRVVPAHRVDVAEAVVRQDAPKIGMAEEADAVEVVGLALKPARPRPDRRHAGDRRVVLGHPHLKADPVAGSGGAEVVDGVEARRTGEVVDAADVEQHVEAHLRVVAQEARSARQGRTVEPHREVATEGARAEHAGTERRAQPIGQGLVHVGRGGRIGQERGGGRREFRHRGVVRAGVQRPLVRAAVEGPVLDALLQPHDGVQHGFRRRRAPRNVEVHRQELVDALDHVVGTVKAARNGARAHRDDPLGIRDLLVHVLQDRHHLVGDRAHHQEQVGLPGAETQHFGTEARDVVPGGADRHELDGAARGTEGQRPHGPAFRPARQRIEACRDEIPRCRVNGHPHTPHGIVHHGSIESSIVTWVTYMQWLISQPGTPSGNATLSLSYRLDYLNSPRARLISRGSALVYHFCGNAPSRHAMASGGPCRTPSVHELGEGVQPPG